MVVVVDVGREVVVGWDGLRELWILLPWIRSHAWRREEEEENLCGFLPWTDDDDETE